ncbi:hypothetical protein QBZ16_003653 [Prototheca wickerhamii]|uniref:Uncharacterized protein n=1 Tax=Prototheca wickerhamii TaxID=3111 RepID=A0AAD9MLX0_PROWI|nr:hypothetical protein QBZ16_003653 [Prototheca wickerhamii]
MATEDAFIRSIIEEEQREKERNKKRKAHEDASKKRERKGKTLDEWEREEGGPVQEAQVAMAHTQRAVRRKEGTALTGDTRLLEVEDLEKAEQELTVAEDDGIKLEPFNLKEERERGHFDEAGNYVEDAKGSDEEEEDAWLGSEEATVVSEEVRRRLEEREARERAAEAAGPLTAVQIARLQHEAAGLLEAGETLAGGLRRLAKALPKRGAKAADAAAQGRFDRLTELGSLLLDAGETDVYSQTKEYFGRAASVYIDADEDEGGRPVGGLLASTPGTAAYEEADEDMFGGKLGRRGSAKAIECQG